MSNDVYLSFSEAKQYVGRGFNSNTLKVTKNEYGTSLGYRLSDLDAFIAEREIKMYKKSVANKPKLKYIGLRCTESEFDEIENFRKIHGIGNRDLVLRVARNVNKSPELLALFNDKFK